ncbi:hypothetical protein, partial [Falsiroseomonas oryzae]|uniref:hypothetical protein n=1 Tax=Falsiroseomonas oryzae TaxID=2766473 RepID=UPI0022EA1D9F
SPPAGAAEPPAAMLRRWLRWQRRKLGADPRQAALLARLLPTHPPPWLAAQRFWFDLNANLRSAALMRWRSRDAERIATPTILFRSEQPRPGMAPDLGWAERSDLRQVIPVRGGHHSMIEPPHRAALCAMLTSALMEQAGAVHAAA